MDPPLATDTTATAYRDSCQAPALIFVLETDLGDKLPTTYISIIKLPVKHPWGHLEEADCMHANLSFTSQSLNVFFGILNAFHQCR